MTDSVDPTHPFSGVPENRFLSAAVAWAYSNDSQLVTIRFHKEQGEFVPVEAPASETVDLSWLAGVDQETARGTITSPGPDGGVVCTVGLAGAGTSYARLRDRDIGSISGIRAWTRLILPSNFYELHDADMGIITTDNFGVIAGTNEWRVRVLLAVNGETRLVSRHEDNEANHLDLVTLGPLPVGVPVDLEMTMDTVNNTASLTVNGSTTNVSGTVVPVSVLANEDIIDNVAGGIDGASNQQVEVSVEVLDFGWEAL